MHETFLSQLRTCATAEPGCDLLDDALIYRGSATCEMWQTHVPCIVASLWALMTEETRLAVYLTAKAQTRYQRFDKALA